VRNRCKNWYPLADLSLPMRMSDLDYFRIVDNSPGADVLWQERPSNASKASLFCPRQCSLASLLLGALSNSSPIHFWKAVMFCGRPRKLFTRSLADIDPPGSSTRRR
jgi:hypothetical protein